jgi:hypothetical protein
MVELLAYGYIPLMSATTSRLSLLTTATSKRRRSWSIHRPASVTAVTSALLAFSSHAADAQYINSFLPQGVPGYDENSGVTVLSRARPLYTTPGVNVGSFVVKPQFNEAFGYDSNPTGVTGVGSSLLLKTSPSVTVNSDWSENSLGMSLSADNFHYFDLPQTDYTNWTASLGGGITIGRSQLTLGYSHLSENQTAADIGAVQSEIPVHYSVDDVRSGYTFDFGRFSLTPAVDVQHYNFDNAVIDNQIVTQTYRDRYVFTGSVTARYSLSEQRNLMFVVQGLDNSFTNQLASQPSNDSTGVLALGGIDYKAEGPWTYRVLVGAERRDFSASQYASHTAPVIAGNVVWTPTGLTTVTGLISRSIEAPNAEGNSGFTYSDASVVVDHELYRNILLQGRVGFQYLQYLQGGGSQTSYSFGASANWLINRTVRLSVDYNFNQLTGSQASTFNGVPNITTTGSTTFTRDIALLTLHFAL